MCTSSFGKELLGERASKDIRNCFLSFPQQLDVWQYKLQGETCGPFRWTSRCVAKKSALVPHLKFPARSKLTLYRLKPKTMQCVCISKVFYKTRSKLAKKVVATVPGTCACVSRQQASLGGGVCGFSKIRRGLKWNRPGGKSNIVLFYYGWFLILFFSRHIKQRFSSVHGCCFRRRRSKLLNNSAAAAKHTCRETHDNCFLKNSSKTALKDFFDLSTTRVLTSLMLGMC